MDPQTAATNGPDVRDSHRLPRTVAPRHYRLRLEPDLDTATFTGSVEIDVDVAEPVTEIVCNAAELEISRAQVVAAGNEPRPAQVHLGADDERATFVLESPVGPGPATVSCQFTGVLNDKLRGFYRSRFTAGDGSEQVIATTQMEATDARRAFPCWDEPDRKAAFHVTLVVADGLQAYSNSPVVSETPTGDGRREVRFAPTMVMSTYLVAFIVGNLAATDPVDVDGVPVRIVHVPGKEALTEFALDVAAHSLRFFTEYFDIPYAGEKLDLAAIPDFAFGAMENLGCVTFRESALLVDPASAARTELERVADVVSHEIAHMWFGDLVTMGWWNGIWLNEAFATFMEVLCVDAYRPAWERWVSFGIEREMALAVDGLHATRPVEYPVGPPEDAEGMFDVLTYQKGGSLLRMLEQYMGPERFRDGVRSYLRAHAYANTETSDLWDALESASGEPVRTLMDSWILQGGHPLVTVDETGALRQEPFSYSPLNDRADGDGDPSAIGGPWRVPVLARDLGREGTRVRLILDDMAAAVDGADLFVNAGGWGFYRTGYPAAHLARLAARLGDLDRLERANLLADTWALVLSGRRPLGDFFGLAGSLGAEDTDPAGWTVVVGALGLLDRIVPDADRARLAAATRALLGPVSERVGWEADPGEGERVPTLRGMVLRALGTIGADPAVRAEASARWARLRDGSAGAAGAAMDPNLVTAVLDVVAADRRAEDFDAFWARHRGATTPQEELRYLYAITFFPDEALSLRAFELTRTEVRTQNAPLVIQLLLSNRVGGPAVWQQLEEHFDELCERLPNNTIDRMLDGVRGLCGNRAAAEDALRFLAEHPIPVGGRSIHQTAERLRVQLDFAARTAQEIGPLADRLVAG